MKQLTRLTSDAKQKYTLIGDDGVSITFVLTYLPTQQQWAFNISTDDFELNGAQLVSAPNILRSYRKIITFGLMVKTTDGLDPFYVNDFKTGRVKLYLLNTADVALIETNIFE